MSIYTGKADVGGLVGIDVQYESTNRELIDAFETLISPLQKILNYKSPVPASEITQDDVEQARAGMIGLVNLLDKGWKAQDGVTYYITSTMADNLNMLVRSLSAVGIDYALPNTLTLDSLRQWRDLAEIAPTIKEIAANVYEAAESSRRNMQSYIEMEYVVNGNKIISDNLEKLEQALEGTKLSASVLEGLQNMHNRIDVVGKGLDPTNYGDMDSINTNLSNFFKTSINPSIGSGLTTNVEALNTVLADIPNIKAQSDTLNALQAEIQSRLATIGNNQSIILGAGADLNSNKTVSDSVITTTSQAIYGKVIATIPETDGIVHYTDISRVTDEIGYYTNTSTVSVRKDLYSRLKEKNLQEGDVFKFRISVQVSGGNRWNYTGTYVWHSDYIAESFTPNYTPVSYYYGADMNAGDPGFHDLEIVGSNFPDYTKGLTSTSVDAVLALGTGDGSLRSMSLEGLLAKYNADIDAYNESQSKFSAAYNSLKSEFMASTGVDLTLPTYQKIDLSGNPVSVIRSAFNENFVFGKNTADAGTLATAKASLSSIAAQIAQDSSVSKNIDISKYTPGMYNTTFEDSNAKKARLEINSYYDQLVNKVIPQIYKDTPNDGFIGGAAGRGTTPDNSQPNPNTLLATLLAVKKDMDACGISHLQGNSADATEVTAFFSKWILDNYDKYGTTSASEGGLIQQRITTAINATESTNDSQKQKIRNFMYVFEEYYKSASAMLLKITQIIEKMAQNISR